MNKDILQLIFDQQEIAREKRDQLRQENDLRTSLYYEGCLDTYRYILEILQPQDAALIISEEEI